MRLSPSRIFTILILCFCFALNLFSAEVTLPYQSIEPGIEYAHQVVTNVPWSIHIIRMDRSRSDLQLKATLGKDQIFGLSSLVEQINSLSEKEGRAVAGINADFFVLEKKPYQGDPRSLQIIDGELVSAPSGEVGFWLDGTTPKMEKIVSKFKVVWPDGTETPFGLNEERAENRAVLLTPRLGESTRTSDGVELVLECDGSERLPLRAGKTYSVRVRKISGTNTPLTPGTMVLSLGPKLLHPELKAGMKLKISTATFPDVSRAETAIGGGPWLVQNGKPVGQGTDRHPRTAFGWNEAHYYFVVVDGRRKGVSLGMNYPELSQEMAALGCLEAMNLDGGGSSTIWAGGKILNQPSDNHIRSIANALICVRRAR